MKKRRNIEKKKEYCNIHYIIHNLSKMDKLDIAKQQLKNSLTIDELLQISNLIKQKILDKEIDAEISEEKSLQELIILYYNYMIENYDGSDIKINDILFTIVDTCYIKTQYINDESIVPNFKNCHHSFAFLRTYYDSYKKLKNGVCHAKTYEFDKFFSCEKIYAQIADNAKYTFLKFLANNYFQAVDDAIDKNELNKYICNMMYFSNYDIDILKYLEKNSKLCRTVPYFVEHTLLYKNKNVANNEHIKKYANNEMIKLIDFIILMDSRKYDTIIEFIENKKVLQCEECFDFCIISLSKCLVYNKFCLEYSSLDKIISSFITNYDIPISEYHVNVLFKTYAKKSIRVYLQKYKYVPSYQNYNNVIEYINYDNFCEFFAKSKFDVDWLKLASYHCKVKIVNFLLNEKIHPTNECVELLLRNRILKERIIIGYIDDDVYEPCDDDTNIYDINDNIDYREINNIENENKIKIKGKINYIINLFHAFGYVFTNNDIEYITEKRIIIQNDEITKNFVPTDKFFDACFLQLGRNKGFYPIYNEQCKINKIYVRHLCIEAKTKKEYKNAIEFANTNNIDMDIALQGLWGDVIKNVKKYMNEKNKLKLKKSCT